jgi:hypothetical protein
MLVLKDLRCGLLACVTPLALCAQGPSPLAVRPLQDLNFGMLIPGVPSLVDPLTLTRSGQLEVQASIGAIFEVRYTLPDALRSVSGGTRLRLDFTPTSGGASASRTPTDLIRFDPRVPTRFRYVTTDRATFFLGGEARPTPGQRLGMYTAPIIVTITNLGI